MGYVYLLLIRSLSGAYYALLLYDSPSEYFILVLRPRLC